MTYQTKGEIVNGHPQIAVIVWVHRTRALKGGQCVGEVIAH